MATFNRFNSFSENLGKGKFDFSTHTLRAAFTNTAPAAANTVLADIVQISTGGGYTAGAGGGLQLDGVTWTQSAGQSKLTISDEVFTASGAVGPFRYIVLYDDSTTSPVDALMGWYDYGSSVTLASGETFTVDFDGTNGVFTIG